MKRICYTCEKLMSAEDVVESICWLEWVNEYPSGWEGESRCMPGPEEVIQESDIELERLCRARKRPDYFWPGAIFFCSTCIKNQFNNSAGVKIPDDAVPHKHFWGVFNDKEKA